MANVNIGTTRDFTPSDIAVDAFTMVMITLSSGNVVVEQNGGNVVTLTAVPVGVWIPVGEAIRIKSTGTTAVGLLVV